MSDTYLYSIRIPKQLITKVDNIHKNLIDQNIKIKKNQIWLELCNSFQDQQIIEKFKYLHNKKINNMLNNNFWNFK